LDEIRSVLQQTVAGGAGKLRNVLSLTDASTKLWRFVSDDVWGSKGFADWCLGALLCIL
jgi:hypothetical protein